MVLKKTKKKKKKQKKENTNRVGGLSSCATRENQGRPRQFCPLRQKRRNWECAAVETLGSPRFQRAASELGREREQGGKETAISN